LNRHQVVDANYGYQFCLEFPQENRHVFHPEYVYLNGDRFCHEFG
jgi:hypothetical protein